MIRVQFLLAASLAITVLIQDGTQDGVKSLLNPSTQEAPKSSQTESQLEHSEETDPVTEERIQREIAEIMAIRKRLGGGVSEHLKGFSIEMPGGKKDNTQIPDAMNAEEAFAQHLAKQSRRSVASHSAPQTPAASQAGNWTIEPADPESAMPAQQLSKPSQERRESVRHAARMLEEAAAILEEASEYDQADKVRQTAGELWRTARR